MGVCFSVRKDSSSSPISRSKTRKSSKSSGGAGSRCPGGYTVPEPEAEETVKEVLSETPKPWAPPKQRDDGPAAAAYVDKTFKQQHNGLLGLDNRFSGLLAPIDDGFCFNFDDRSEDASMTDKQDRGEVEKVWRRNDRSPARAPPHQKYQRKRSASSEFGCRRESSVAVRRDSGSSAQQQSLATRAAGPAVARTNSVREMGQAARSPVTSGAKREPGERSGSRSVSPAAKSAADSRHNAFSTLAQCRIAPSTRANGRASPRRFPPPAEEPAKQWGEDEGGEGSGEEGTGDGKESLDNPLVSLECFIFL